jgi:hypothetical protein
MSLSVPDNHERLMWAALGLVAVLVAFTGALLIGSVFFAPHSDNTVQNMIEGRVVSRGIVLFLIVPTIAVLCVQDKITGEAALAALSAIAGYILGGTQPGQ